MTFHALVDFIRYEEQKVKSSRGGLSKTAIWIVVKDINTKRTHWLGDWSGNTDNAKLMESCKGHTLDVQGFVNAKGKIHFCVLEKWGIWDADNKRTRQPDSQDSGYIVLSGRTS